MFFSLLWTACRWRALKQVFCVHRTQNTLSCQYRIQLKINVTVKALILVNVQLRNYSQKSIEIGHVWKISLRVKRLFKSTCTLICTWLYTVPCQEKDYNKQRIIAERKFNVFFIVNSQILPVPSLLQLIGQLLTKYSRGDSFNPIQARVFFRFCL